MIVIFFFSEVIKKKTIVMTWCYKVKLTAEPPLRGINDSWDYPVWKWDVETLDMTPRGGESSQQETAESFH